MTKPPKQSNHGKVPLRGVSHLLSGSHASWRLIPLTQGKYAIVDAEDYPQLSKYKWQARKKGNTYYASRGVWQDGRSVVIYMHRQILGAKEGEEIDHIDHNGLDNRECNIRICTRSQNNQNQQPQKRNNTSRYKGVHWNKKDSKWIAQIKKDGTKIHLGSFDNENIAAEIYNIKAKEIYGEFAHLNIIDCTVQEQPEAKCVKCGKIFYCADDYDTLGSDSGVCCPVCGGEDFEPVEQPSARGMTKKFNEKIEELKSMFTVSQAMARNNFDSVGQPIEGKTDNPDPPPKTTYPEQPPASNFTKGLRRNVQEFPDFPRHLRDLFESDILRVCDRLDAETQRVNKAELLAAFYLEGLEKSAEELTQLAIKVDKAEAENKSLNKSLDVAAGFDDDREEKIEQLEAKLKDLLVACKRLLGAMFCDELNNGQVFDDDLRKEVKEYANKAIEKANNKEISGKK